MAETRNAIEILVHDHHEVEEMFTALEGLRGNLAEATRRKELSDNVIIELVRHSVAEEQYLYPFCADRLPGGAELVDRERLEHAEAENTMNALDKLSGDNVEFDQLMATLMAQVRQHISEEETELFPQLQATVTPAELTELGGKIEAAKKVAPTRPHPLAPDTAPMNKILGPGTGLVDRMRDAITGRGATA